MKSVAVIGAGAAGLTATKRLTEPNSSFECCTFEQSDNVGGIWVYTDRVGTDEYGILVHSSMYKGLITNLPKEIMELTDHPYCSLNQKSYITSQEVLDYFEDYVNHFNLKKFIKFRHLVNVVKPLANGQWKIDVTDLRLQKNYVYHFDAVIICIGNYSNPVYPRINGISNFEGIQIHSHDYKEPSKFKGMDVILIGAGPSGVDISNQISHFANKVYLSHHSELAKCMRFPENLIQKSDVTEVTSNEVVFEDGSVVKVDAIVYCTGYEYKYSFLSPECNVTVENMVVKPLYKHFVNIEHPTMSFIGIPFNRPGFSLFDLQVRCFLKILKNEVTLPSRERMYEEIGVDMEEKYKVNGKRKYYHSLNKGTQKYFDSISELGNLPKIRQVVFDIYYFSLQKRKQDFRNFRSLNYKVVDDRTFEVQ